MILAPRYATPIPYWLGLPIRELVEHIHMHNDIVRSKPQPNAGAAG